MALIVCKMCGKEVSDKAKKCPSCGTTLIEEEIYHCKECGGEVPENAEMCPACGCPVEHETAQRVELAGVAIKKPSRKVAIAVAGGLLAFAAFFGIRSYREERARQLAASLAMQERILYSKNLKTVCSTMLDGASNAEQAGNLVKKVWSNAIHEKSDSQTNKYTRNTYGRYLDFNDALNNLFSDASFVAKVISIEENQNAVDGLMKELKSPPEGYEEAYSELKNYYSAYTSFTNLVISPSGSLNTFSSNFNDLDSEVLSCYKAMDLYLDDNIS